MIEKLEGMIVWFINWCPDSGRSIGDTMKMTKEMNKPLMEKLAKDGRYISLWIPTVNEATRVVKIDYNAPFPRYMPKSSDVNRFGLPSNDKKQKKEEAPVFCGLINLFINFCPEVRFDIDEVLELIPSINKKAFDIISEDGRYQIMIVPTTKEASRVEKIDFEMPFPRLVVDGRSNESKKMIDKESDDYDEIEDEDLEEEE